MRHFWKRIRSLVYFRFFPQYNLKVEAAYLIADYFIDDSIISISFSQTLSVMWMLISIISVSVLTSIITSDMVDSNVPLYKKQVVVMENSWEDFIARLLVNRVRKTDNILRVKSYIDLLDAVARNKTIDAGLVDNLILRTLQEETSSRNLGIHINHRYTLKSHDSAFFRCVLPHISPQNL